VDFQSTMPGLPFDPFQPVANVHSAAAQWALLLRQALRARPLTASSSRHVRVSDGGASGYSANTSCRVIRALDRVLALTEPSRLTKLFLSTVLI
jgi:hypothetical protein